jgi:hypothetical protein
MGAVVACLYQRGSVGLQLDRHRSRPGMHQARNGGADSGGGQHLPGFRAGLPLGVPSNRPLPERGPVNRLRE